MNGLMILLLVVILVPAFIATMFIPYWTRRTESFGVSIPEAIYHTDSLKKMRKQYVVASGVASIVVVAVLVWLRSLTDMNEETFSIYFSILIFLYVLVTFFIYLYFHRVMKRLKKTEKWGKEKQQQVYVDTEFRNQKLTYSNLWFGLSFLITFTTVFFTFMHYDKIPDQIPMQYNLEGDVTNWADKSYRSLLMMPIVQVYLTLVFMLSNTIIAKAKQQINAEKPTESMQQNVIFRRRWSLFLILAGIALTLLLSFAQVTFIFPIDTKWITIVPLLFTVVIVAGVIILSITTGQGGSRVKLANGTHGEIIDRDDDQYWKLGQFYFNKQDPALFLEKRFGVGWTINFARPLAWILFLGIILLAIGLPFLLGI
ncbi:DUF1648 domain-containing protein [Ornithinibacillus contaminans]|uniref:DUF1648 domain-containing protein n=1 Tax=Ornithinibacillus contaminans TaxID=694055 RepID=UPI00069FC783|nr:DUF5808 domain-containing protein [Ornithinibacillus contaminans]